MQRVNIDQLHDVGMISKNTKDVYLIEDLAHGHLVIKKRVDNLQCVPVLWLISTPAKEYL